MTYCLCCLSYYCRSTTSSTPYYFLKPWTMVNKNRYWVVSLFEAALPFFVVIGSINMRRRLSRVSHMTHPHHGTVPSCFCTVQNTTRTRIPTWSSAGTSYLKTGYSLPVDRFRLSLPGRFNLGCIVAFASVWSRVDREELFQLALHRTRHCITFSKILVC